MELPKTIRRSPSTPCSIYFGGTIHCTGAGCFLGQSPLLFSASLPCAFCTAGLVLGHAPCLGLVGESGECRVLQAEHSYINSMQGASRALLSGVHAQRNAGLSDRGQCQCWRWSLQADRDAQVAASTTSLQHFAKQVS